MRIRGHIPEKTATASAEGSAEIGRIMITIPGEPECGAHRTGATWSFASAENRDFFTASPEKYAPPFGGRCGWAVNEAYTAPADPKAWAILGGQLYVNFSAEVQIL